MARFDRKVLRARAMTGDSRDVSVNRADLRRLLGQADEYEEALEWLAQATEDPAVRAFVEARLAGEPEAPPRVVGLPPEVADALASAVPDDSMTAEARRWLLKGEGEYAADGKAADLGYAKVKVKPFSAAGADVWFFRSDDPEGSHHVEFGRTGGEMLVPPGEGE